METRQSIHSDHARQLDTAGLRREFLVEQVFVADQISMTYSHIDRIVFGGIEPVTQTLAFGDDLGKAYGVDFFLQRRELGLINIGGPAVIEVDGQRFDLNREEALYVGMGARDVRFSSVDSATPAKLYYNSAPAHTHYPTRKITLEEAAPTTLGDNVQESSRRTATVASAGRTRGSTRRKKIV